MDTKADDTGFIEKKNLRFLYFVIVIVIILLFNLLVYFYYIKVDEQIKNEYIQIALEQYSFVLDDFYNLYRVVIDMNIDKIEVKELFQKILQSKSMKEKNIYYINLAHQLRDFRDKSKFYDFTNVMLYSKNEAFYLNLLDENLLISKNPVNGYFNESLQNTDKPSFIFQISTNSYRYKFIYPLYLKNERVGFATIDLPSELIMEKFLHYFNRKSFTIIIKDFKKVRGDKFLPFYINENQRYVLDFHEHEPYYFNGRLDNQQIFSIEEFVHKNIESKKAFSVKMLVENKLEVFTFLPIVESLKQNPGFFCIISDGNRFRENDRIFRIILLVTIVLSTCLIIFVIYINKTQKKLEQLSIYDSLTQLYSRYYIISRIQIENERFLRYNKPYSVVMFDIDHFKKVNDTYGHLVGDMVLRELGSIIRKNIRKIDSAGRYGGEEFLIVLPETKKEQAFIVAEKLRNAVNKNSFPKAGKITISGGVAEVTDGTKSYEDIIRSADKNLYIAKQSGRDKVVVLEKA